MKMRSMVAVTSDYKYTILVSTQYYYNVQFMRRARMEGIVENN